MIYLDYSANTPADERVLARFCAVERRCPGNANSHHQAGLDAKAEIDHATQTIARLLRVQPAEIIYTSGASESNNFALKGLARLSRHVGKHIISTPLEHSSVSGTLTALQEQGYEIDLVDIKRDGTIDLDHLKELLRPDTIVVAVTMVDSELGVVQPVQEIAEILKEYPHCHLHVDATQAVGKIPVSFEGVDTMSLTAAESGAGASHPRRREHHHLPQRHPDGGSGLLAGAGTGAGRGAAAGARRGRPKGQCIPPRRAGQVSQSPHQQPGERHPPHPEPECAGRQGHGLPAGAQ